MRSQLPFQKKKSSVLRLGQLLAWITLTLLLQNCFLFEDAPRDNPFDPKNPNLKVVRDGLEAWWKFDNGSLADEMGVHNGSYISNGGIRNVPGRISSNQNGGGISSDSSAITKLILSENSSLGVFPFTIDFWLKLDANLGMSTQFSLIQVIENSLNLYRIALITDSSSLVRLAIAYTTGNWYESPILNFNGNWAHITLVANSPTNYQYSFLPASETSQNLQLSTLQIGGAASGGPDTGAFKFSLFLTSEAMSTSLFQVDDLRFYRRALSKEEIQINHLAKD